MGLWDTATFWVAKVNLTIDLYGNGHEVTGRHKAGFICLLALLGSFLFIRTSARMIRAQVRWWPGSVEAGGVHIHHLVWGICTMMITGFLVFALEPAEPWYEILAGLFGFGAGLTLDEFALWVHLEDVYWTDEGRSSVDAVIVAVVFAGMILVGLAPLDLNAGSWAIVAVDTLITLSLVAVCVIKGKKFMGMAGVFIPLLALIGAIRLAKPKSRWAKKRYTPEKRRGEKKLARSKKRYKEEGKQWDRFINFIGGKPSQPDPDKPAKPDETPEKPEKPEDAEKAASGLD